MYTYFVWVQVEWASAKDTAAMAFATLAFGDRGPTWSPALPQERVLEPPKKPSDEVTRRGSELQPETKQGRGCARPSCGLRNRRLDCGRVSDTLGRFEQ